MLMDTRMVGPRQWPPRKFRHVFRGGTGLNYRISMHRRRNHGCSGCSCTHNIHPVGADNVGILHPQYSGTKRPFMKDKNRGSCYMTKFSNILVNITVKVASKSVKSIRYRFIVASYYHRNLGIPSTERHQRRWVLDSAPCTHNVPNVPTPMCRWIFACGVFRLIGTRKSTAFFFCKSRKISATLWPVAATEMWPPHISHLHGSDMQRSRPRHTWWLDEG